MKSASGHCSLIQELKSAVEKKQIIQILGAQTNLQELSIFSLLVNRSTPKTATKDAQAANGTPVVLVLPNEKACRYWFRLLQTNLNIPGQRIASSILPAVSYWGIDRYENHRSKQVEKLVSLYHLASGSTPSVVITTLQALSQTTPTPQEYRNNYLNISLKKAIDPYDLIERLEALGYRETHRVEEPGYYSLRGGLLDIFPVNTKNPIRIELIEDEVDAIRSFSAASQRSLSDLDNVTLAPAQIIIRPRERIEEQTQTLFDHLVNQDISVYERNGMTAAFKNGHNLSTLNLFSPLFHAAHTCALDFAPSRSLFIFPETIESCIESFDTFLTDKETKHEQDLKDKKPTMHPGKHFKCSKSIVDRLFENGRLVEWGNPQLRENATVIRFQPTATEEPLTVKTENDYSYWISRIRKTLDGGGSVTILVKNSSAYQQVSNCLSHQSLPSHFDVRHLAAASQPTADEKVAVCIGEISSPIWDAEYRALILNDYDLLGKAQASSPKKSKIPRKQVSLGHLQHGDVIVHIKHGIGRFLGIKFLEILGVRNDFIALEYQGGDKVYIPVNNVDQIQKYVSSKDDSGIKSLDRLGGKTWDKKKAKVKESLASIADELIQTQASRQVIQSPPLASPNDLYYQMVDDFPFTETEDQLRSLDDIEADLSSGKVMDRLLVGDVGYGKTEVALRATMRIVLEGKQVLILVPTTVLCYQQYKVFHNRLTARGVRVEQINRFITKPQQKRLLDDLARGKIDVIIGTHRLLSKDVNPKELGLIVVDEEQRFGVVHKEKLKGIQSKANVLTLSATPIPRTLHLAMLGVRNISILATAPANRLPIKTVVAKFNETIIRDAITNEIQRGGQVFFLHNRVEELQQISALIKQLVPLASCGVAHGQMKESQLEETILNFLDHRFQILICTTIIESGIDMPNVNTLIVNQAERFGLAQLYQIRGRVGRSSTQAYAFFLSTHEEQTNKTARRRLDILASHQNLGSGFQIAQYDMEIRGVGDLLGRSQSGNIASVGFDMYLEMLNQAIKNRAGTAVETKEISPEIRLKISSPIPQSYITSEQDRLEIYNRIFSATNDSALLEIKSDVEDRYGKYPKEFSILLEIARLKLRLKSIYATMILSLTETKYEIRFSSLRPHQIKNLLDLCSLRPESYQMTEDFRLILKTPPDGESQTAKNILKSLLQLIDPLALKFGE